MQDWKHESNWNDWHWQIRNSPADPDELADRLDIPPDAPARAEMQRVCARYRCRATPYYLALIDPNNPDDPIRKQCRPDIAELADAGSHSRDPFEEISTDAPAGVVHRYPDRVLLAAASVCAVYCRHCTRKNTLENLATVNGGNLKAALDYIRDRPVIREVLISGGDPLLLVTEMLDHLLTELRTIPHIEVIRIGTRVPVVLPMRIDAELGGMLRRHAPVWVNTQFNHPLELTAEAVAACRHLTEAGIPLSNQSVLLKGVNDDFPTMRELCAKLQCNLIRPYYVFVCDPIAGIEHFRASVETGIRLEKELREALGGLAVPRFVADIPGEKYKTPLAQLAKCKFQLMNDN